MRIYKEDSLDDLTPEQVRTIHYHREINNIIKKMPELENDPDFDFYSICEKIADEYNVDIEKVKKDIMKGLE